MTNPKVVTEEQVEAAAKALAQKEPGSEWDDFDEREFFLRRARQALEAAFSADEREAKRCDDDGCLHYDHPAESMRGKS